MCSSQRSQAFELAGYTVLLLIIIMIKLFRLNNDSKSKFDQAIDLGKGNVA